MFESPPLSVVLEQVGELRKGFHNSRDNRPAEEVARFFHKHLVGVSSDALRAAVTRVIHDDEFFPKIARLRKVAAEIEAARERERKSHAIATSADEQTCPQCRQRYYDRLYWAPNMITDADNRVPYPELTANMQFVLLHATPRLVCDCAAPSMWLPLEGIDPPMAEVTTLLEYHKQRVLAAYGRRAAVPQLPAVASA